MYELSSGADTKVGHPDVGATVSEPRWCYTDDGCSRPNTHLEQVKRKCNSTELI